MDEYSPHYAKYLERTVKALNAEVESLKEQLHKANRANEVLKEINMNQYRTIRSHYSDDASKSMEDRVQFMKSQIEEIWKVLH